MKQNMKLYIWNSLDTNTFRCLFALATSKEEAIALIKKKWDSYGFYDPDDINDAICDSEPIIVDHNEGFVVMN